MFFQVYGEHALAQWGMLLVVLLGLILLNEFARRTKTGGIITFLPFLWPSPSTSSPSG